MTNDAQREIDSVVDAAIDRAVREMMHVDTPAGTRGRVLSRIEHPTRPLFSVPRLAAATALAALIVLAFIFTREPVSEPAQSSIAPRAPETAAPNTTIVGKTPERGPLTPAAPASRTARRDDSRLPPATLSGGIAIAPLPPLDPIVVRPLQPSPVAAETIIIEPLAPLAELEIEPLFPSDGRD